jgi:alpha-tubulin suppressor-like RCC1 family protein
MTFAIKTDGTLWSWGGGYNGGLVNGSTADRSSPTQINGTNWKFVSAGKYNGSAIKTDGTLWLWGSNNNGQLGDGTTTNRSSPVQTVAAGTNWKAVANGGYLCMAIKTDGTLWTWGQGSTGALGDGTTNPKSSPIQTIVGGTNWKTINCSAWAGYGYGIAIRDNS